MLFVLQEFIDVIVMTLGLGFIFMDFFTVPRVARFDLRAFGLACLVIAPAVILHELGHKFVAIGFGADATFHAAYLFLLLGIILKLIRSPFIFFVPGYVAITTALPFGPTALVALAGPAVNGVLYLMSRLVLKQSTLSPQTRRLWIFARRINGFLFIFNMLPVPGFDGFTVFSSLFHLFG